jgi:hypothetical protein
MNESKIITYTKEQYDNYHIWYKVTNITTTKNGTKTNKEKKEIHKGGDKPAYVVYSTGETQYWYDGKLHRQNGPAIIRHDGQHLEFFHNGLQHNENGYAIICKNGVKYYFVNNKLHRDVGPAIDTGDPSRNRRYINGKFVCS